MKEGTVIFQGKTEKGLEVIIRYPKREDAQILRHYINTLSKERTYILFQGEQLSLREEKKYLNSVIKQINKNEAIILLVFHKDQLIAETDIKMQLRSENHVGAFGISVAKDYRSQGVGKLLMDLVIKEAKINLKKLKIIRLGVFANNFIAQKMYQQFGFIKYGNLPKGFLRRGQYVDHVYMYKNI